MKLLNFAMICIQCKFYANSHPLVTYSRFALRITFNMDQNTINGTTKGVKCQNCHKKLNIYIYFCHLKPW